MTFDPEEPVESALVEVSPGTAIVFGQVPEGLDLIPFSLVTSGDQIAIAASVAAATSILNVGGQLANGLAQAQGLVRLAPETLRALQAGASPIQSGGYNIGVLAAQNGKFATQVRWLPVGGANAAGVLASVGPAVAMIAIQIQLNEISGLVQQNLVLTETVLKTVRRAQWAELSGLEQSVTGALKEANVVGEVTAKIWSELTGKGDALRKQRNLFSDHVKDHSVGLAKLRGHQERRQFIESNGEAILLDLYSLLIAHKSWFEYQALRAAEVRLNARDDPREERLLNSIIDTARKEYAQTVEQMTALLDALNRELWILAELPGRRTIAFTGSRRSAKEVAGMAQQLLDTVGRISGSVSPSRVPLEQPNTCFVEDDDQVEGDLSILRWHLERDETLSAIASAHERGTVGTLAAAVPSKVLIAVTDRRVLLADASEFRKHGFVRRSVSNDEIRYVRYRDDDGSGRAEIDLITKDRNLTWRFAKGSASAKALRSLGALLADRMDIPPSERDLMRKELPLPTPEPDGLSRQLEPEDA